MKESKILLVTGASSDVGGVLIRRIADNYSYILAHYNQSKEQINRLVEELGDKIIPIQADFSDSDSVEKMIINIKDMHKHPDHIVHLSAPKFHIQKFIKEDANSFRTEYVASVEAIIRILMVFAPTMSKQKYGKIVFMLTKNVINYPAKYQSLYTTTKYALYGLMKSLAVEYADKGISVNGISPTMMETKFLSEIPELIIRQNADTSPLKRNLLISEVVPSIVFLLSDETDAVTGVNIPILGGIL